MKYFAQACLLTLLAVVATGCHQRPSEQEKQVMAQLSQSMKTQCMGRYLVDLPESFQWFDPNVTLYYGKDENFKTLDVDVLDDRATPESVAKDVASRATKIAAETLDKTGKSTLLAQIREGSDGVMLRYYTDSSGIGIDHQLHLLVGHAHVLIKGSSYESLKNSEYADLMHVSAEDLTPAVEARMLKLAANIHPVTDPEKAGPGFCLGSVVVNSNNDYEQGTLRLVSGTGNSRMTFEVNTSNFKERDPAGPDLIQRNKDSVLIEPSVRLLRQGTLVLAGMSAQEVLTTEAFEGRDTQAFTAETSTTESGAVWHALHLDFEAGGVLGRSTDAPSPLTNNEATGLWDAIMKSVRPRPNAGKPAAD